VSEVDNTFVGSKIYINSTSS